jgi:hypothetical protein
MNKPELPLAGPAPAPAPHAPVFVKAPRPAPPTRVDPSARDDDDRLCDPASADPVRPEPIIGSGDRAHHLALVPGTAVALPRRPSARTGEPLQALRPASRQACERRCGKAGQCDPASPFGCGGEFCMGFEGRLY